MIPTTFKSKTTDLSWVWRKADNNANLGPGATGENVQGWRSPTWISYSRHLQHLSTVGHLNIETWYSILMGISSLYQTVYAICIKPFTSTFPHTCKIGILILYLIGTTCFIGMLLLSSVRMHLLIYDKLKRIE